MKYEQDDIIFNGSCTFTRPLIQYTGFIVGTSANFNAASTVIICENTFAQTLVSVIGCADNTTYRILGDGFTTVPNNALIKTNTGAAKLLSANKVYRFTQINGILYEDA